MVIQVLETRLAEMHLGHLIATEVLAELEPDQLSDYMSWVNDVIEGRAVYLPAEAQAPFTVLEA